MVIEKKIYQLKIKSGKMEEKSDANVNIDFATATPTDYINQYVPCADLDNFFSNIANEVFRFYQQAILFYQGIVNFSQEEMNKLSDLCPKKQNENSKDYYALDDVLKAYQALKEDIQKKILQRANSDETLDISPSQINETLQQQNQTLQQQNQTLQQQNQTLREERDEIYERYSVFFITTSIATLVMFLYSLFSLIRML